MKIYGTSGLFLANLGGTTGVMLLSLFLGQGLYLFNHKGVGDRGWKV
jgi:hypothetical protein